MARTPAPWRPWRLAPDSDPNERLIITTGDGEEEVTGIIYNDDDAELIAAAPDLYEALRDMASMLRENHQANRALEGEDEHEEDCSYCAAIAKAERALAKADGTLEEDEG